MNSAWQRMADASFRIWDVIMVKENIEKFCKTIIVKIVSRVMPQVQDNKNHVNVESWRYRIWINTSAAFKYLYLLWGIDSY